MPSIVVLRQRAWLVLLAGSALLECVGSEPASLIAERIACNLCDVVR